jgi:hypothetical protein
MAFYDRVAVLLIVLLAFMATLVGVRSASKPLDVDERVYVSTLHSMQHGEGYYPAMRDALIVKEHRPPRSVRAIRPPILFLVLRWVPSGAWRWVVGLVYLADLFLVWRLARGSSLVAGPVAVVVAGVWLLNFAFYLFLHAETWGAPFMLAGLLSLRARRDSRAATLFAVATCIRETFGLALVLGIVAALWRRTSLRPWVAAAGVVLVGFFVHAHLAHYVLNPHGFEAKEGNERRTLDFMLRVVSPWAAPIGYAVGLSVVTLAIVGAWRTRMTDAAAAVTGLYVVIMIVAAEWATRIYWSAAWALPASAYVPAAFARRRHPAGLAADTSGEASMSSVPSHSPVITSPWGKL